MSKLKQGVLLQVTKPGFTVLPSTGKGRKILLEVDEVIEIHHAYAWHFRTMDGEYYVADEDYILEYCQPFGEWIDTFELRGKINTQQIMAWHFYRTQGYEYQLNFNDHFKELLDQAFHAQYKKEAGYMERRAKK